MTLIVPTGVAPWTRSTDFAHYGGALDKQNYLSRGAIDALTDVDAASFARMTADMAALARVAPFAVITLVCNDAGSDPPTIEASNLMTGVRAVTYEGDSAPTGFPSGAHNSTGSCTLTFDTSYTDSYGVLGAFSISHVKVGMIHTSVARAVAEVVTANTVRLRAFDASDAPLSGARMILEVW